MKTTLTLSVTGSSSMTCSPSVCQLAPTSHHWRAFYTGIVGGWVEQLGGGAAGNGGGATGRGLLWLLKCFLCISQLSRRPPPHLRGVFRGEGGGGGGVTLVSISSPP